MKGIKTHGYGCSMGCQRPAIGRRTESPNLDLDLVYPCVYDILLQTLQCSNVPLRFGTVSIDRHKHKHSSSLSSFSSLSSRRNEHFHETLCDSRDYSGPFVLTRPMIDLASTNRGEFVHDMRNHHHYLVHYLVHRLVESKGRFINMIIIRCVYDAPFRRSSFSLPPSSFSSRRAARLHGETPS